MRISTFKFGSTPLFYTSDGTVARGIILPQRSAAAELAQWLFAFAAALLVLVVTYSMGRSMASRIRFAVEPARAALFQTALVRSLLPKDGAIAALLPLSAPEDISIYRNIDISKYPVLEIPKLRVTAPIVESTLTLAALNTSLKDGVVRWPDSAAPGTTGSTILLGHSSAPLSYHGAYGAVFALLDKLRVGDTISIQTAQGTLAYRVYDRVMIKGHNYNPEDFRLASSPETLILVSCWPVGTSWQRIAIRAARVTSNP